MPTLNVRRPEDTLGNPCKKLRSQVKIPVYPLQRRFSKSILPWISLENQIASNPVLPETSLTRTLWFRQVALDYRHDLPVLTVLVLLCKEANSPGLTGVYERQLPDGWQTNRYNYRVVRLWR